MMTDSSISGWTTDRVSRVGTVAMSHLRDLRHRHSGDVYLHWHVRFFGRNGSQSQPSHFSKLFEWFLHKINYALVTKCALAAIYGSHLNHHNFSRTKD